MIRTISSLCTVTIVWKACVLFSVDALLVSMRHWPFVSGRTVMVVSARLCVPQSGVISSAVSVAGQEGVCTEFMGR